MSAVTYLLRTSNADGTSYGGFQWPESGPVEAPDWNPEPVCGGGLHGLLMGVGDASLLNWSPDARWQVVEVMAADVVSIDDEKVKVPRGIVVCSGSRTAAADYLMARGATCVPGSVATAGDSGTATAGRSGTATAGRSGTAMAGYSGTATAGDYGTATAGYSGTATAGDYGTLVIHWHDGARYRIAVGYVGEDGIEPAVAYRLDDRGQFVRVTA